MEPTATVFWMSRLLTAAGEVGDGQRADLHAFLGVLNLNAITIKDDAGTGPHQMGVPVGSVLVKAEEKIQLVAVVEHFLFANADGEEDVAASDNGLVGVIGVEMKAPAHENAGQNVARGGDSLTGFTTDGHGEIELP